MTSGQYLNTNLVIMNRKLKINFSKYDLKNSDEKN